MPEPLLLDRFRPRCEFGWIKLGERPGADSPSDSSVRRGNPVASVPTVPVTAERFEAFNEAGFAKIAESICVNPHGERFSGLIGPA